ncbi:MAG: alanine--tRNA ligase [candidate division KSB1 bacterium]|nr:alanine--tRNA ligase [candidate division KSB1 bacterium]MDZ7275742.1 alanine--tRNA ligase [candidate division KSB1 bacterium]MDZ7284567.1 alanine--tRNA ligase [candidate division KSB1 bacterium]MDZ7298014.1 alanine--tRNA ligase [candidate division KSB1 bacterium]MDZ7307729.1 alanine--tRNA ligase [candidate division KSB1 bacterium]
MKSKVVRQSFLDFFKQRGHTIVPSASVVPLNDPTLLFTNAGMNQFKNIFLGTEQREYKRAVDTQKCIRVSGKHNDLEDVGFDTYHHTFFEMLGNWSFGDYYKAEAIAWAWELLTREWGLPKDRLYATVYKTDDEAADCWRKIAGLPGERIQRFGEKDNFWEMGETGPCGPCSEIHIDLTPDKSGVNLVNAGDPRVMEIWNLVFIQYNRAPGGALVELPAKHVDTGMGFERVLAVLNNVRSNYDTDLFTPILEAISAITGKGYDFENGVPHRVLADHIRCLTFAIADGVLPSNEGRGYVLRRLLRRAARFGRKLGMHEPFVYKLVQPVVDIMGDTFSELHDKHEYISRVIKAEEESFNHTLDRGLEIFNGIVTKLEKAKKNKIPGEEAFRLYDTYGFPLDLTQLMARERDLLVDEEGFNAAMAVQKSKSREAGKWDYHTALRPEEWRELTSGAASRFVGYTDLEIQAEIRRLQREGEGVVFTLSDTPFYAESGGQVGDQGRVEGEGFVIEVVDVQKVGSHIAHIGRVLYGEIENPRVVAKVDARLRLDTARNHTATHLLHRALRDTVGKHVTQAGSLVAPARLRFDVTHFERISPAQLEDIEGIVNEQIRADLEITTSQMPYEEARRLGAMAIFEEKYGDIVRVVRIGDFSLELCGGTHLRHTGEAGLFALLSEGSAAAGIRRLEAATGRGSEVLMRKERRIAEELRALLNTGEDDVIERVRQLLEERKALERELRQLRLKWSQQEINDLASRATPWNGFRVVTARVEAGSTDDLKQMGDTLRAKLGSGVGVLAAVLDDKLAFACVVTDDLIQQKKLKAGDIVKRVAAIAGGSGGGRPHLALAGGKEVERLQEALNQVPQILQEMTNR